MKLHRAERSPRARAKDIVFESEQAPELHTRYSFLKPEDVKESRDKLAWDKINGDWDNFTVVAKRWVLFFPDRKQDLPNLTEEDIQGVAAYLSSQKSGVVKQVLREMIGKPLLAKDTWDRGIGDYITTARDFNQLFPERKDVLGIDADLEKVYRWLIRKAKNKVWSIINLHFDLAVLFPQLRSEIPLTDEIFLKALSDIKEARKKIHSPDKEEYDWHDLLSMLAGVTLLFPNRKAELQITPEEIQQMIENINPRMYYEDLPILMSERAELLPNGQIKVTPSKTPGFLRKPAALPTRSTV